jgi:hypothetical protein
VAGEVENPGRFELAKAATLSAIFSEVAKPLAWGQTGRIRVYRNGTRRDYDLKRFGDVTVSDGDVVEVPIKSVYEGQGEVQDQVFTVFTEDAKEFMEQVAILKSDLWKARPNWREGIEGIEFRRTGKIGLHGGVSVFARVATPAELAAVRDKTERTATIDSHAVIVIARDPGRGAKPSEFESTLVTQIRAIPSHRNRGSESGPGE